MFNRSSDALFVLVKSLTKAEKKNFKLYVTRNSRRENLRTVQLFDILDKMKDYDEEKILQRFDSPPKQQLLNIKGKLYAELLSSLRLLKEQDNIDLRIHEQMDYARILYTKGLYVQSLKVLAKLKEMILHTHQFSYLQQVLFLEKNIEGLHITRSMQGRADQLAEASNEVNKKTEIVNRLSNLSLQLYSWYITNGHAHNEEEELELRRFFNSHVAEGVEHIGGFYPRLFLYQSYCWLKFIMQDFFRYYRYVQKWVLLFERYPVMKSIEVSYYIKGLHNLASAHFYLRNFRKLDEAIALMESLEQEELVQKNESYRVPNFIYLYTAKINKHFLEGRFSEGLVLVPYIEAQLRAYKLHLDNHRILVFYYKIACLYFGSGDNDTAIDYLNKIINWKTDLRMDLQCYARLLHLIAHYELGNYDLLEYLSKSVYRMMAKMGNMSIVEEEVFQFLKMAMRHPALNRAQAFQTLLSKLKGHMVSRFETRAYSYLDITSWLESKLTGQPVQAVIRAKYLAVEKHK